jgi:hypothetical protein
MDKKCFVIMPISDCDGYPSGHFKRVYDFLIAPAVKLAGFEPIRADDIMTTNYIALDILKKIIEFDMAICDLSSRNPNVLYELGIRQAFNLPVTFIKDTRTNRVFDIQGFRDVEYDESLRIDTVQEEIESISIIIKNTYENKHEINSLVSLLGIEPAKITDKKKISLDTELILNTISGIDKRIFEMEKKILPNDITSSIQISPQNTFNPATDLVSDYLKQEDYNHLKVGELLYSEVYGPGIVNTVQRKSGITEKISISFNNGKATAFIVKYSKFRKIIKLSK